MKNLGIADMLARQALMGKVGAGNLDLYDRPSVSMPNGSEASTYSMTFTDDDGKYVLVPGVRRGLPRAMEPKEAYAWYKKTGEHFGKFDSLDDANKYAEELHQQQAALNPQYFIKNMVK